MRRCPPSLRALCLALTLIPAVSISAAPYPPRAKNPAPESKPAPPPFREPDEDPKPSTPLGGPAVPLSPTPAPQPENPTPKPTPVPKPVQVRPTPKALAQRPSADNPPTSGQPLIPGVTYSGATEDTVPGSSQPPAALGPAPYNLGDVKKIAVGDILLDENPMRVGNLDLLVPLGDTLPFLGASLTQVDAKTLASGILGGKEPQSFQLNVSESSPVLMTVGQSTALIDSNEEPLRCAPLMINGKLWLPVFSVAPLIGAAARLDNDGILHLTPTIQSVEVFPVRDYVALTIKSSVPINQENTRIGYLKNPDRLYIDFVGFSMGFDAGNSTFERPVSPGAGDVYRARAGMPSKFPDVTRITLDLKRPLNGLPTDLPRKRLYALVLVPQDGKVPQPSNAEIEDRKEPAVSGSLRGYSIVVDAGHGGHDTGARGVASLEKDHALDIALRLAGHLRGRGANVLLTRADDTFVTLQGRATFANTQKADLFVSCHINASVNKGSQGTETYYYTAISQPLASEIHKEFLKATGRPNRGVRQARFYVIRKTYMPSVLLESAFITNTTEENLLRNSAYREKIAVGITRGIINYVAKYGRN